MTRLWLRYRLSSSDALVRFKPQDQAILGEDHHCSSERNDNILIFVALYGIGNTPWDERLLAGIIVAGFRYPVLPHLLWIANIPGLYLASPHWLLSVSLWNLLWQFYQCCGLPQKRIPLLKLELPVLEMPPFLYTMYTCCLKLYLTSSDINATLLLHKCQ